MKSLADDFPRMQAKIRGCRENGVAIGPAGAFYVMMCDDLLTRAEKAVASWDVVEMIAVYKEMKEFKE